MTSLKRSDFHSENFWGSGLRAVNKITGENLDLDGQDLIYLDVPEKMNAQYKKKTEAIFALLLYIPVNNKHNSTKKYSRCNTHVFF
jgi:hypothetical protein